MRITVIVADSDGETHFVDRELELVAQEFAPPSPPMEVSAPIPHAQGRFFRMAPGWFGDWHPTPCLQYFMQATGELEVTVSDGEVRRLHPGDVVYLEDTEGKGHTTRVVSGVAVTGAFVQLPTA
jgi:quercetin dioxygenase-like cupin family protein